MASVKRHNRSSSLGKYSFLSCFNGVTEESSRPASSYEKLRAQEGALSGQKKLPTIRLGGKTPGKFPKRSLSFSSVVMKDGKGGLGGKVKEACEQALEVAKQSTPHISELFVGGQLFLHVTPASFSHKCCKQQTLSPSIGFLNMASPIMDASLQERRFGASALPTAPN